MKCERIPVTVVTKPKRRRHYQTSLARYVPARLRAHLEDSFRDQDGYWFYFADCVQGGAQGSSIVHEDTIAEAKVAMSALVVA
jgi:hypothetical protein